MFTLLTYSTISLLHNAYITSRILYIKTILRPYHTKLERVGVLPHMGVLPHPNLQHWTSSCLVARKDISPMNISYHGNNLALLQLLVKVN